MAEDGEGSWKTTEAMPWEDSDRDYTYEEVPSVNLTSNYCTPPVAGESLYHHQAEQSKLCHRAEEETGNEATSGGACWGKENVFC